MGVSVSKSQLVNVIVVLRLLIKSIIVLKETKVLFGVVVTMSLPLAGSVVAGALVVMIAFALVGVVLIILFYKIK